MKPELNAELEQADPVLGHQFLEDPKRAVYSLVNKQVPFHTM